MKIAIEVTPLMNKGAGLSRFVFCFLKELAKIDQVNEYILYYHGGLKYKKRIPPDFDFKKSAYKIVKMPLQALSLLRNTFKFPPMELFLGKPDIFWSTNFDVPLFWGKTKIIYTVYDLSPFIFPGQYDKTFSGMRWKIERSIKKADVVLAISENTKKDIIRIFNIPTEKINVVYCGVSEDFFPINDENVQRETKNKYCGGKEFILSVGTLNPRKNFIKLIEAFAVVRKNIDIKLVIAGKKGWLFEEIYSKVKELNIQNDVIIANAVNDKELNMLYNSCSVFVFPSLYEGFGIPIIEAFACGAPVCASNASSVPEVAGDAALYFDPNNAEEMADCIVKILKNKTLRDEFIKKGFKQVKNFSWKNSAIKLLEIFKNM